MFKVAYFSDKKIVRLYRRSRLILAAPYSSRGLFSLVKWPPSNSNITHVLLVTLVCKNKYRAPSRCIGVKVIR